MHNLKTFTIVVYFQIVTQHCSFACTRSTSSTSSLSRVRSNANQINAEDGNLLLDIEKAAFKYFWEQGHPCTGLVKDRSLAFFDNDDSDVNGDKRDVASIAATGFGLVALCIAYENHANWTNNNGQVEENEDDLFIFPTREEILSRVQVTLEFIASGQLEGHQGFYYHFVNMSNGERVWDCELSSIDTALLLGGVLTARQYFRNHTELVNAATAIYDGVNYDWMLNGTDFIQMGWTPEGGFSSDSWNRYCELLILLLQGIGSTNHSIPTSAWDAISRNMTDYEGFTYIDGNGPLFTHQYSHAFIYFQDKADGYANYFENSVAATKAHKEFCIKELGDEFPIYNEDYWGITASDSPDGYTAWGGLPAIGPSPNGSIVPCAVSGSIPFLPESSLHVLHYLRARYGNETWSRYGFIDAFNPGTDWYNPDVIGINLGIGMLMAENYRTGFVWKYYMKDPSVVKAMQLVGFKTSGGAGGEKRLGSAQSTTAGLIIFSLLVPTIIITLCL